MLLVWTKRILRILASVTIVALVTVAAYTFHVKSFATGFIFLMPIMVIAFQWGFLEASIASVLSVGCLDYFFTEPLFHLYMSDPQDWIALVSFEAIVLLVSRFASRLQSHAAEADHQREQIEKLYLMSRDVLLLDHKDATGPKLARLIQDTFQLEGTSIWDARDARMDNSGTACILADEVRAAYLHEHRQDDAVRGIYKRELLIGSRSIGAIGLAALPGSAFLNSHTADAVASLAALALEQSYSLRAESDAQASKQTEQLRSAVLDGLAHAFKTPLSTIQAASSGLLEMDGLHAAQQELASLINQEALHLGRLTTQALQTAQMDDEHLNVRKEKIEIVKFLDDLFTQSKNQLFGHPLQVVSEASAQAVWGDERLLKMALWELLDNASKYANPGAPITLGASTTDVETVFSVMNQGSYIEPEERIRIFRRFYRSPHSRHQASGTGIGLSFVKRIAEAHLGRVWVKSDLNVGTTFFFTLPHGRKEV